jgi:hypothetical protein
MGSLRRSPLSRVSFACVTRVFPFAYFPYTEEKGLAPMTRPLGRSTDQQQQIFDGATGSTELHIPQNKQDVQFPRGGVT